MNDGYVDSLARDMAAGRWLLTHQGVAFDVADVLIDGQHRLHAIVRSGVAIKMAVATGIERGSVAGIDQGSTRLTHDILKLSHGKDVGRRSTAIANAMIAGFIGSNSVRRSKIEQVAGYLAHEAAITYAESLIPAGQLRLMNAGAAAVVARASYSVDRAVLARFCEVLISGLTNEPRDASVILLRDFLKSSGNKGTSYRTQVYRKTVAALDAFRAGKSLGVLRAAKDECFFLPGEKLTSVAS